MSEAGLDGAIAMMGAAGIASLFLPSLDQAWRASPDEPTTTGVELHEGERLYVAFVGVLALLHTVKARSVVPLVVGVAVAGFTVHAYRRAYRADLS